MKRFVRTTAGKTLLFMSTVFLTCILIVCTLGAVLLAGMDVYRKDRKEFTTQNLTGSRQVWNRIENVIWAVTDGEAVQEDGSLLFSVLGPDGSERYRSPGAEGIGDWVVSSNFAVYMDEDGKPVRILMLGNYIGESLPPYETEYTEYRGNTVPTAVPGGRYDSTEYRETAAAVTEDGEDDQNDGSIMTFEGEPWTVRVALGSGVSDEYSLIVKASGLAYSLRFAVYIIGLLALVLGIVCFVALMAAAGRRPDSGELFPGPLNPVPYDILLAVCAAAVVGAVYIANSADLDTGFLIALIAGLCLGILNLLLGLAMSTAIRLKQRSLLRNTVIFRILKLLWLILLGIGKGLAALYRFNVRMIRSIPLVWKSVLCFLGLSLLFIVIYVVCTARDEPEAYLVLRILLTLLLLPAVVYIASGLKRLQTGGRALAAGDLSYVTETKGLPSDLREHAENLNSLAVGQALAVEERMKSERMKTELITNVSHDIKTPLTSIINYAGLISAEACGNEKHGEYAEVLVRQSERLKHLLEDLVEASKAASGNLEVDPVPCDASVFLSQAVGEYEEKLLAAELTPVTKQPERELRIMADGRRMWRVFDNLMNNICKYSQPGTRVYITLEEAEGNALFTFKNTSREPLDMTEEELFERFTRGDSSRNTEGNGLGLSIARSLTELQGGTLRLSIDGDLFKAVLSFPLI